jgi:hypothetical protein
MNGRSTRVDIRIAKSPVVRAYEQSPGSRADERQRDTRPGRFAVRGSFIDLSQIRAAEADSPPESGT